MKGKAMTESAITAFLGRKVHAAMNDEDGELSDVRQQAYNYYQGKKYENERDGYSQIVTRECLETLQWALPNALRMFDANNKPCEFMPVGPGDEEQAAQETDIVNHVLTKENNAFLTDYSWFTDALMYPNGYVKMWIEEKEKVTVETYTGLSQYGLAQILQQEGVEPLEHTGHPDGSHDIKYKHSRIEKQLKCEPVAPEQVLVDNDLKTTNCDDASFIAHRFQRTYTELVEEGYDRDKLDDVGSEESYRWNSESVNRLFLEDEDPDHDDETGDNSLRKFWVHECYVYIDADGDGLAERRKINMIGSTIFDNEELDYQPFVSLSSIINPHRHSGMSLTSIVQDLQLIKSTLFRQLLDNIYRINIRRKYIGQNALVEDGSTWEALADNATEDIPVRDPLAIVPEITQPIISDILPVLQAMDAMGEKRTGVAPSLSLDPNVLKESTEGAFMGAMEAASQRIEMLVRVFAETGKRQQMLKAHQLLRMHMDVPKVIRMRQEWVEVNPTEWKERNDLEVSVGIGFSTKEQKMQLLMTMLGMQKEALGAGMATPEHIHNTLEKLVDAAGLGDVSAFFADPATVQPPEPQEDPMVALARAQVENEGQKTQQAGQKMQFEAQHKTQLFSLEQQKAMREEKRKDESADTERTLKEMQRKLTEAQVAKTDEETRGLDIENDALESGAIEEFG